MDSIGYSKDLHVLSDALQQQQKISREILDFQKDLNDFTLAKVTLVFFPVFFIRRNEH